MLSAKSDSGGVQLQQLQVLRPRAGRPGDRSLDRPGETVALLGPNGAGKSTTIDMILGLAQPDSGSVTLFGLSPAEAVATGGSAGCCRSAR